MCKGAVDRKDTAPGRSGRKRVGRLLHNGITLHMGGGMDSNSTLIRGRLDRAGIVLSGLCAVHCLAGIVLVGLLGLGGQFLLAPAIHEVGLALAVVFGAFSLGLGVLRHGRLVPLVIGGLGLSLMALALFTGHGTHEAILTICGVALVATAHIANLRGHGAH